MRRLKQIGISLIPHWYCLYDKTAPFRNNHAIMLLQKLFNMFNDSKHITKIYIFRDKINAVFFF